MNIKILGFAFLLLVPFASTAQVPTIKTAIEIADDPSQRQQYEYERIADPVTGKVPFNELEDARDVVDGMVKTMAQIPGIEWAERGPNNIGGRIRFFSSCLRN
jgi:hypothetical protein